MNNKIFSRLIFLTVLLIGVFVFLSTDEQSSNSKEQKLLADINGQNVGKIKVEQGDSTLELELKDGYWKIPAKNYYKADSGKVRSLLLSLFDLTANQIIPTTEENHEKLGLSDNAIKTGNSKVTLFSNEQKILASLHLGAGRKGKNANTPLMISGGQYVKKDGSSEVYLIEKPIATNASVVNWLDLNLLNVLPATLFSIVQVEQEDNSTNILFELLRENIVSKNSETNFVLKGGVPEGKVLQSSVVNDLRSALEDLTIANVFSSNDESIKGLNFNRTTIFKTISGLVYSISSAEKDNKNYIKISLRLDKDLISKVKDEFAKILASTTTTSMTTTTSLVNSTTLIQTNNFKQLPLAEPAYSTEQDLEKMNSEFKDWVYEVPTYKSKRFRISKTELLEAPKMPTEDKGK